MSQPNDVSGTAALAICESLLLALNDRGLLPEHEIIGVLRDAATAHQDVSGDEEKTVLHAAVAKLIAGIIDGGILFGVRERHGSRNHAKSRDAQISARSNPACLQRHPSKDYIKEIDQ